MIVDKACFQHDLVYRDLKNLRCQMSNQKLAKEIHKPIIRKFEKWKVYSSFIDKILGAYLANIQLISKFNKRFWFLLCVINIFSKYAWIVLSKDKNSITIFDVFQEILNESGCKPNKIWADKGNEFYNRSMKSWLQDNDLEIYSTHNEGKYVVAERFIRTLKNKV